MKVGDEIQTQYGRGIVLNYRECDRMYKIELSSAKMILYCTRDAIISNGSKKHSTTRAMEESGSSCIVSDVQTDVDAATQQPVTVSPTRGMDLNTVYESLETMRKLNLQVACQEKGILLVDGKDDQKQQQHHFMVCAACLIATAEQQQQQTQEKRILQEKKEEQIRLKRQQQERRQKEQLEASLRRQKNQPELIKNLKKSFLKSSFSSFMSNKKSSFGSDSVSKSDGGSANGEDSNVARHDETDKEQIAVNEKEELEQESADGDCDNRFLEQVDNPQESDAILCINDDTKSVSLKQESSCVSSDDIPVSTVVCNAEDLTADPTNELNLVKDPGNTTSGVSNFPVTCPSTTSFNKENVIVVTPVVSKLKKCPPCLICNTPCCKKHSSVTWRKHMLINMCTSCEMVFGLEYITSILTAENSKIRQQRIDHLMDMYDRITLLLKYSSEYVINDLADTLDRRLERRHLWGIGSSSAGMISGVLGLAATAALFTPAGPPLLIASLVFGGSASAVQTGADVRLLYSEPQKMANRILALYATLLAIIRVVSTIRDALVLDQLQDLDRYLFDDDDDSRFGTSDNKNKGGIRSAAELLEVYDTHRVGILMGVTATRSAAVLVSDTSKFVSAAEMGSMAGKNLRFMSRGSVAAASTASSAALTFAQFAGGTLSAATLLLEAHSMKRTLETFHDGCSKAKQLRRIKLMIDASSSDAETTSSTDPNNKDAMEYNESTGEYEPLPTIPTTKELETECNNYMAILSRRIRVMTEAEVTKLLMEQNESLILSEDDSMDEDEVVCGSGDSKVPVSEQQNQGGCTSDQNGTNPTVSNKDALSVNDNDTVHSKRSINNTNGSFPSRKPRTSLTPAAMLLKRIEQHQKQKRIQQQERQRRKELAANGNNTDNDDDSDVVSWNDTTDYSNNGNLLSENEVYCEDDRSKHAGNSNIDPMVKLTV